MSQNFAAEDDVEMKRRLVFAEDQRSLRTDALCAVSRKPGIFVVGKAIERSDSSERRYDLRQRSRHERRCGNKLRAHGNRRDEVVLIQG
jgi:hypothetical protein